MPNPSTTSGVFPCYENQFKVGPAGSEAPTNAIADMEEYSVTFDNGVEEWNAYGEEGWIKRHMTSKSVKIAVKGKRNIGDTGNDMVAAIALKNGKQAQLNVLWTFPDGSTLLLANAVISVSALNAAASTNMGPLEFEIQSNGKPTFTPAA